MKNNSKKTTPTNVIPENLEQAVGGYSAESLRAEMDFLRDRLSRASPQSEDYIGLATLMERYKGLLEELTSDNSRTSNVDNCKKMISDAAKAHADVVKSQIKFQ